MEHAVIFEFWLVSAFFVLKLKLFFFSIVLKTSNLNYSYNITEKQVVIL